MTFTAIDFETATGHPESACAVGIITVDEGVITDQYYTLIQPPWNQYSYHNIRVHGITPEHTRNEKPFDAHFSTIRNKLFGRKIVAHNEQFDRNVLRRTMQHYGLYYDELEIADRWECTCRIYRAKGYKPANLKYCSERNNIVLNHHDALSDALACARLYLMR
jgi:DNA polymerase-3 subunit epsilon